MICVAGGRGVWGFMVLVVFLFYGFVLFVAGEEGSLGFYNFVFCAGGGFMVLCCCFWLGGGEFGGGGAGGWAFYFCETGVFLFRGEPVRE